ncbi:cell division protein SepF [uncultured Secundilactobacillus sp.]|uniref:cell division protein SepF n=1 Tax=uncultured Secundilactobacillus sp. TaxID=2813935 RepID=UPI002582C82B|nr:cell division protein SepF [uncultured Secundilactobacillus sp.]
MARFSLSRFFGVDDDDYDAFEQTDGSDQATSSTTSPSRAPIQPNNKVVSINAAKPTLNQIVLFEPRLYSDVQEIASQLMKNQAAVVNFSRIEHDQAVRIVDFLTGALYAIDGDIERIGNQIFLCTPSNYEVSGDISANFSDNFNKE